MRFDVESYLETHARKFVGQFDPCCYLYLSRAMDLFDACDSDETLKNLFRRCFTGHALVIGVETDILFPLHQQRDLAGALESSGSEVTFEALPSIEGHDAFLVDFPRFEKPMREWLA
jgi:homoserine O-acetyltransferase